MKKSLLFLIGLCTLSLIHTASSRHLYTTKIPLDSPSYFIHHLTLRDIAQLQAILADPESTLDEEDRKYIAQTLKQYSVAQQVTPKKSTLEQKDLYEIARNKKEYTDALYALENAIYHAPFQEKAIRDRGTTPFPLTLALLAQHPDKEISADAIKLRGTILLKAQKYTEALEYFIVGYGITGDTTCKNTAVDIFSSRQNEMDEDTKMSWYSLLHEHTGYVSEDLEPLRYAIELSETE
ncbi:hypothetical protein EBR77_01805 [bacterium]|nr:hypothetical protein [bacterium]NBX78367.1 hypothetical protein [bacterium]